MLTAAPMPTDTNGFTPESVVLKLFAAINDEKQAAGKAAKAKRKPNHLAVSAPTTAPPGLWV